MQAVNQHHLSESIRDIVSLAKPRITLMVLITTAGGLALAGGVDTLTALYTLLGTALVVGSANTLNCWLERDSDRLMTRTKNRPLPDGRMKPARGADFWPHARCHRHSAAHPWRQPPHRSARCDRAG